MRYEEASPGLGGAFDAEVQAAFRRIVTFPEHGSPYLAGTRRVLLPRFHISIVYVLEAEGPLVVAFAPDRMRPGYWIGRVRRRPGRS